MAEEALLSRLMLLGFTKYEARAYIALLKHGSLTSSEIIKLARIPQPRIYDIMDSLVSKGFVRKSKGKPIRYTLVDPKSAFRGFMEAEMARIAAIGDEVLKFHRESSSHRSVMGENVWVSHGYAAYMAALSEVFRTTEDELLAALYSSTLNTILKLDEFVAKLKELSSCFVLYDLEPQYPLPVEEVFYKPTYGPTLFISDLTRAWLITGIHNGREPLIYHIEDIEITSLITMYFFEVLRRWSKPMQNKLAVEVMEQRFRSIVRAVDMVRGFEKQGLKAYIQAEGVWLRTGEPGAVEGVAVETRRDELKGITSIVVELADGNRVSVGGLGARYEDFAAVKIRVKAAPRSASSSG
ncbi:MAG: TrmB family transcriptional regulator sugar-binding domain-containing protein [Thermosphaera sp.]